MKLLIGLGNPGDKYKRTRHNVGFMALDYLLKELADTSKDETQEKFHSLIVDCEVDVPGKKEKVLFVYPQTFMNNSGEAVKEIMSFYKLEPEDIIVLHDEIDLPLGSVRLTQDSGAAGHNGVKSIIDHLSTSKFTRVRIGIENRIENRIPPTDAFVLEAFTQDELEKIPFDEISKRVKTELEK